MRHLLMKNPATGLRLLLLLGIGIIMTRPLSATAADTDRKAVVRRHNPHITYVDTLASLTVGNGSFAMTVDATGLQTFPEHYSHGVPLGTMADWGWHSFPNFKKYSIKDVLREYDFGRGHNELYAVQPKAQGQTKDNGKDKGNGKGKGKGDGKDPDRGKAASDYLRSNPHRMHLGCVGFNFASVDSVKDVDQTLDLWTGCVKSRFRYGSQPFHVETACDPREATVASRVRSNGSFTLLLRVPYPTGAHSDDGCDWKSKNHYIEPIYNGEQMVILRHQLDQTEYFITLMWSGRARLRKTAEYVYALESKDSVMDFYVNYSSLLSTAMTNHWRPMADVRMASVGAWAEFWRTGRFVDFSKLDDPRARELERRVVLSRYLMNAQEWGIMPPQETGLTYNSWFGKFHLEMAWWHLAHWAMWDQKERLDRSMGWYLTRIGKANTIAKRQGFKGVRWMKMTDPWGGEAPSNTGSFLIWQQPEPILLAELLYDRSSSIYKKGVLMKYGVMVDSTAAFMADFAERDADGSFHLRHYIPAQESLSKDSVEDSPLELAMWHEGLRIAQEWRVRQGKERVALWDSIMAALPQLACNGDSLYLASATTPNSFTYKRYYSDHPAVLGAYGMMPPSRLVDAKTMRRTADWIYDHWNWATAWGWDFPMMAMTYARLGDRKRALDALLMDAQKNTYLVNGHNYQDSRLRIYMPGNGALLAAVALMDDLGMFGSE